MSIQLPLFPLQNIVLFPNMVLPLHIFEPRYVRMTEACLKGDRRFGVVLIASGEEVGGPAVPCKVGTIAHIREHREMEAGRYMLITVGEQRVRIVAFHEEDERLVADVEPLADEPAAPAVVEPLQREVAELAIENFRLIREVVGPQLHEPTLPSEPAALSFFIAAGLQVEPPERQALLELTDTAARLTRERDVLRAEVANLARRLEIHDEVEHVRGGNGKLKHAEHLDRETLRGFDPDGGLGPDPAERGK